MGETLYEINMKCHAKPVVSIHDLKSPLGVSTLVHAELFNPTQYKAHIRVTNSNSEQFLIKSSSFRINPMEKKSVEI